MFQFSPSQKEFVRMALVSDLRTDGRLSNQRRAAEVRCNVLDNLAGSAYVSIDQGKCEIYTGVKLKIAEAGEGTKGQVFLQLSSMRKLNKEQASLMVYLQQLLQLHFINKEIKGFTQLTIPNSKKHYLQMHIQTFILSEPHLSLLEPLYLSVRRAIQSTSIPKFQSFFNEVTNEETVELTEGGESVVLTGVDALLLVGCYGGKYMVDLTPLEFEAVEAVFLAVVKGEKVRSLQSLKGAITTEEIHKVCRFAVNNAKSIK